MSTEGGVDAVVDLAPGAVLAGRFELMDEGARDEIWRTFRARSLETGETVAVLVADPALLVASEAGQRLDGGVKASQQVQHASIVRVASLDTVGSGVFLTLEWVEGPSLLEVLRERGPLSAEEGMMALTSLAGGLETIQRAGLPCPVLTTEGITLVRGESELGQPKFNPLNLSSLALGREDASAARSTDGPVQKSRLGLPNPGPKFAFALAVIAYEMFGGKRCDDGSWRFVPMENLPDDANRLFRFAFDPTKGFRSPSAFVAELGDAIGDSWGVVSAPEAADVTVPPPRPETPRISRGKISRVKPNCAPRRRFSVTALGFGVLALALVIVLVVGVALILARISEDSGPSLKPASTSIDDSSGGNRTGP